MRIRFALLTLVVCSRAVLGQNLGIVTVTSDSIGYGNIPLRVDLPLDFGKRGPFRLQEMGGHAASDIPAQWDSLGGNALWFILPDSTPPRTRRVFQLEPGSTDAGSRFSFLTKSPYLEMRCDNRPLMRYNFDLVPAPPGVDPVFARKGAYIHPLFSPMGDTLTDDFPSDHYHHHGIFMPWRKGTFEGHPVDFWLLDAKQGTVRFREFGPRSSGPVFAGFVSHHDHVDLSQNQPNGKNVLAEEWKVMVFSVGGPGEKGSWIFDITSTQRCAGAGSLKLSPWDYQGMTFRGPAAWMGKESYLTPSGSLARPTREKWQVMSGAHGKNTASIELMSHPGNFRFPEPTTIWPGLSFFGYTPPAIGEWILEPGISYVFRYRYHVIMGRMDKPKADQAWYDFAAPPSVSFQVATASNRGSGWNGRQNRDLAVRNSAKGMEFFWPGDRGPVRFTLGNLQGRILATAQGKPGWNRFPQAAKATGALILRYENKGRTRDQMIPERLRFE